MCLLNYLTIIRCGIFSADVTKLISGIFFWLLANASSTPLTISAITSSWAIENNLLASEEVSFLSVTKLLFPETTVSN